MVSLVLSACAHGAWYSKFEKITMRSVSFPIPIEVQLYLMADQIILPRECNVQPSATAPFSDDDCPETHPPSFAVFSERIRAGIELLGGAVFLKTNWQAPKDAFWITAGQTLRCRDISDAYQLLKASSCTKEDVARGGDQLLVLREWMDVHPGTEFRCYVRSRALIGKRLGNRREQWKTPASMQNPR